MTQSPFEILLRASADSRCATGRYSSPPWERAGDIRLVVVCVTANPAAESMVELEAKAARIGEVRRAGTSKPLPREKRRQRRGCFGSFETLAMLAFHCSTTVGNSSVPPARQVLRVDYVRARNPDKRSDQHTGINEDPPPPAALPCCDRQCMKRGIPRRGVAPVRMTGYVGCEERIYPMQSCICS